MHPDPKKDVSDVPDAELAVLQVLWERGPCTIRQLADVLYPGGKAAHYGTVQKLLERLENLRGYVTRDRSRWPHVFEASVPRETLIDSLIGRRLRETAEKLCGGSMTPLLLHLLDVEQLDDAKRRELWAFLDQLRQTPPTDDPGS
jgi:predicted transcriptional regulator